MALDTVRNGLEEILQAANRYTVGYDRSNAEVQALIQRNALAQSLAELAAIGSEVTPFIPSHLGDRQCDLLHGLVHIHDNPPDDEDKEMELLEDLASIC